MIKATGKGPAGQDLLFIGLSFGNLDKFRAAPLDSFIKISATELGLSHDVIIFSGKTEADMLPLLSERFGPGTKVTISDKLKN